MKAVVADGATAASFADYRNLVGLDEAAPFFATMYTAARVLSGSGPGEPLEQLVARIAPTPLLLIGAGKGVAQERDFNRLYAAAAREPVELWDLPEVHHTAAIRSGAASTRSASSVSSTGRSRRQTWASRRSSGRGIRSSSSASTSSRA